jgi:hypothetical protein
MVLKAGWANKYGYFSVLGDTPNDPTSMNYGGDCAERIENLRARGYGLYSNIGERHSIVYWQKNCHRLEEEQRLLSIQKDEEERLIQEEEMFEDLLRKQLENERKQNEIKRKEITKVQSIKPVIIPEITPEITPTVVATSSLLPLGIIALLLYSRTGRK